MYTGPRVGGLLNATLGNAAELIITIFALREGLLELVRASIIGSILGNLLLVMGLALWLGGLKNVLQVFDRRNAMMSATLLILAFMALAIPSLFDVTFVELEAFDELRGGALAQHEHLADGLAVRRAVEVLYGPPVGGGAHELDQARLVHGYLLPVLVLLAEAGELPRLLHTIDDKRHLS